MHVVTAVVVVDVAAAAAVSVTADCHALDRVCESVIVCEPTA